MMGPLVLVEDRDYQSPLDVHLLHLFLLGAALSEMRCA